MTALSLQETLNWLTSDIKLVLAGLKGTSEQMAKAVVLAMPFGSQAALEDLGLIAFNTETRRPSDLVLLPLFWEVVKQAKAESPEIGRK